MEDKGKTRQNIIENTIKMLERKNFLEEYEYKLVENIIKHLGIGIDDDDFDFIEALDYFAKNNERERKNIAKLLILVNAESSIILKYCDENSLKKFLESIENITIQINGQKILDYCIEENSEIDNDTLIDIFFKKGILMDDTINILIDKEKKWNNESLIGLENIVKKYSEQQFVLNEIVMKGMMNYTFLPKDIINVINEYLNTTKCKKCEYVHLKKHTKDSMEICDLFE